MCAGLVHTSARPETTTCFGVQLANAQFAETLLCGIVPPVVSTVIAEVCVYPIGERGFWH